MNPFFYGRDLGGYLAYRDRSWYEEELRAVYQEPYRFDPTYRPMTRDRKEVAKEIISEQERDTAAAQK